MKSVLLISAISRALVVVLLPKLPSPGPGTSALVAPSLAPAATPVSWRLPGHHAAPPETSCTPPETLPPTAPSPDAARKHCQLLPAHLPHAPAITSRLPGSPATCARWYAATPQ